VQEDRIMGARLRQRVGHVALFVALAVVPVLALNSLATATVVSDGGTDATAGRPALTDTQRVIKGRPGARGHGTGLTDAQRQCLAEQGVSLPTHGAPGPHASVSAEQRDALREAATTCGLPNRARHGGGDAKI
jgi:hypothetical protein